MWHIAMPGEGAMHSISGVHWLMRCPGWAAIAFPDQEMRQEPAEQRCLFAGHGAVRLQPALADRDQRIEFIKA